MIFISLLSLILLTQLLFLALPFFQELANPEELEESSKWVVRTLYEALNSRDVAAVQRLVAPDLEWWFHGPPSAQFLMRLLTGDGKAQSFLFLPDDVHAIGSTVLAEGSGPDPVSGHPIYWVHAWTVSPAGAPHGLIVTHVREYFNTSLVVTQLGPSAAASPPPSPESLASSSSAGSFCLRRPLWQSSAPETGNSMPGLVLAI